MKATQPKFTTQGSATRARISTSMSNVKEQPFKSVFYSGKKGAVSGKAKFIKNN